MLSSILVILLLRPTRNIVFYDNCESKSTIVQHFQIDVGSYVAPTETKGQREFSLERATFLELQHASCGALLLNAKYEEKHVNLCQRRGNKYLK